MERIVEIKARLENGRVITGMEVRDLTKLISDEKKIVLLKNVFSQETLMNVRKAVLKWGRERPPVSIDDFEGNYHRLRAMVSNMQKAPHVFHDYNFNDFSKLERDLFSKLHALFEPLRLLYNELSSNHVKFEIPPAGPFVHPQIIHYPIGGGFFARHWHDLLPQKLGFIVALSKYGVDYPNGGTVFEIDGKSVNVEGRNDMGDICLWRYDYPHWVTQSDLKEKFDWNSEDGRWVATFPYYDSRR